MDDETQRIVDVPWMREREDYQAHTFIAGDRWTAAGIPWTIYSEGGGGTAFLFETVADREKAAAMIADLRDEARLDYKED